MQKSNVLSGNFLNENIGTMTRLDLVEWRDTLGHLSFGPHYMIQLEEGTYINCALKKEVYNIPS